MTGFPKTRMRLKLTRVAKKRRVTKRKTQTHRGGSDRKSMFSLLNRILDDNKMDKYTDGFEQVTDDQWETLSKNTNFIGEINQLPVIRMIDKHDTFENLQEFKDYVYHFYMFVDAFALYETDIEKANELFHTTIQSTDDHDMVSKLVKTNPIFRNIVVYDIIEKYL
jgi:hypothetical protein